MDQQESQAVIARLEAQLKAKQKTIEVLMDAAEKRLAAGASSIELLSQNLNLERVVQQKTEALQQQGEQLKQTLRELQFTQVRLLHAQKLESVGRMAAGIAHEINTPMQFIGSNIEFLDEAFGAIKKIVNLLETLLSAAPQGHEDEAFRRQGMELLHEADWPYLEGEIPSAIQQTREGIRRISSIVQAMKNFSRPSSREKEMVSVNLIIETTVLVSSNEWNTHAYVSYDLSPDLPLIPCYAGELGQVVLNLLLNAAQAIEEKMQGKNEGREKGEIRISTRAVDAAVEIRVRDTGGGIPAEIQDRVFDPFFTTRVVGRGKGQGLAVCHDVIVQKHGGSLSFETEEGKGTTFIIRLPRENMESSRGEKCGGPRP